MTRRAQPDPAPAHDVSEFTKNMATAAQKCQVIMQEFLSRQTHDIGNAPFDPLNVGNAFSELFTRMMSDPMKLWEQQCELWQDYMHLWQNSTQRLLGEDGKPVITPDSKDKRFR